MDNLWTRRSNSSKLSLSTGTTTNGGAPSNEHPTRNYNTLGRRHGDSSSHSTKNPFNTMSPSSTIASPTAGASSAFGLGSGAFASFGTAKTPKTSGGALDFSGVVGAGAKTPPAEKTLRDMGSITSKMSLSDSKTSSDSKNTTPLTAHPLRHSWAFWFRPPISKSNGFVEYEKTLHSIAAFDNVEDFFEVYKHLKRPSTLPLVSDYHIFKKGIRPIWEDDDNKKGGKWVVRLKKGVADRYWEDLVFALIGDQFEDSSDGICGAVLSVRNGEDILSIWTRDASAKNVRIRKTMSRILAFPDDTKLEWKSHDSSLQQRQQIDEARKDKTNQNHHNARNGSKDEKQIS